MSDSDVYVNNALPDVPIRNTHDELRVFSCSSDILRMSVWT